MRWNLEVISPLHIGSGGVISPIEYEVADRFYRADMDKVFEDNRFDSQRFITVSKGEALYLGEFAPGLAMEHVRYALDISHSTKETLMRLIRSRSSEVREYIKTGDEAYIPGSSIKGAMRTAILWWVLKNEEDKFSRAENYLWNIRRVDNVNKKRVDDEIEKEVFGKEPMYDILRVLRISDTETVSVERLRIEEVRTLTTTVNGHKWKKFYTFIEALKPGTKFNFDVRIDEFLLTGDAVRALKFEDKREYVKELPKICNEFAHDLIKYEIEFFRRYNTRRELDGILEFYEGLMGEVRREDAFLLRLSWGSGWQGMTVGRLLQPSLLRFLRRKFRMGKAGLDEFPKTRRVVFENGKPKYPLGWVRVKWRG